MRAVKRNESEQIQINQLSVLSNRTMLIQEHATKYDLFINFDAFRHII